MNPRSKAAASSMRRMMVSLAFSSLAVAIMSFAALAGDGIASRLYWNRFGEVQRVAVDNPTVIETAFDFQPLGTIHDILVNEAGGRRIARLLVGARRAAGAADEVVEDEAARLCARGDLDGQVAHLGD